MIDPDEVPEEWRVESDRHPKDWNWENSDDGWDDSDQHWQWVHEPVSDAGRAAPAPWYRGPTLLLGLIGLAAATLVVATALLVGGRFSGEIPTSHQLDGRTATPASQRPRTPASSTAQTQPSGTTVRSTEPTESAESATASSNAPEPTEDQAPEPIGPPPPSAAPAPPPPAPKAPDGPRVNVTRTPMSFTPSVSARP